MSRDAQQAAKRLRIKRGNFEGKAGFSHPSQVT